MLYKLGSTNGTFDRLEPVAFKDFSDFENKEKDLENLIAENILEVLYEQPGLMPIFQEREGEPVGDIYALNEQGELVIFELKRNTATRDAIQQALRYAQDAGQWSYSTLEEKYRIFRKALSRPDDTSDLTEAHREAFGLEHPLEAREINAKQHLLVIGSAADDSLIDAVDYWKRQGVSIGFLPYRIYEFGENQYFEFFALPYDRHSNPRKRKGVLFDTNERWNSEAIWYMMENQRVAAFEDAAHYVERINPDDIVFFSHRGKGVVAAAKIKKGAIQRDDPKNASYRDVEFITPIPQRGINIRAMLPRRVSEITGKSFYWPKTIKNPYLSKDEAERLAEELRSYLESDA